MEQITVSEPNSLSDIQEIPLLLRNYKLLHYVCKTTPLLTVLSLLHSAHNSIPFVLTTVLIFPSIYV